MRSRRFTGVCPVCGLQNGGCSTHPSSSPVDVLVEYQRGGGALAHYQDAQGHIFSMTAADAAKQGYTLVT